MDFSGSPGDRADALGNAGFGGSGYLLQKQPVCTFGDRLWGAGYHMGAFDFPGKKTTVEMP